MSEIYSWLGFIAFWIVVALGSLALLALVGMRFVYQDFTLFGYRLIKDEEFWEIEGIRNRVGDAHRWLSAFHDLDPIWEFVLKGNGRIEDVRMRFAKERGRTVYNEPIEVQGK